MSMERRTILKIIDVLNKVYGVSYFKESDPFRVLIGTILSHRTKGGVSWAATNRLFEKAKTPEQMVEFSEEQIARIIYPVGFYRQKAKRIRKISKIILEKYGGEVPRDRIELMKLPGVGSKTADCVLCFAYGDSVIPVDIHVLVLSKRLGIADKKDTPEKVREKLHELIPKEKRGIVNALFVEHGKKICTTRKAYCKICPIERYCPKLI